MRICPRCQLEYREGDDSVRCVLDGAVLEEALDPMLGRVLAGRYRIERGIGVGGMATVYRATTDEPRAVAVKVLNRSFARDVGIRARFSREVKTAAALAHPNVVEIYDSGETEDGAPFLVMELLVGDTLRGTMASGPSAPALALTLGVGIARGLARAHDFGVVHRDLKPENVFVVPSGSRRIAKLVDFGIARRRDDVRLTRAGGLVGSPPYLAPERIHGEEDDPSSDLYSLGVVLFELLTGRLPFIAENALGYIHQHLDGVPPPVRSLRPDCPEPLAALVARLLAKQRKDRPVDAHQVERELSAVLGALEAAEIEEPLPLVRARVKTGPTKTAPLTPEQWERRASILGRALDQAFAGAPPAELKAMLVDLRAATQRVTHVRMRRRTDVSALAGVDAGARERRESLGRAVEALGTDLSTARERLASLRAEAQIAEAQIADLSFQIDALRRSLATDEALTETRRAASTRELTASADEATEAQKRAAQLARALVERVRDRPGIAPLLAELESA
jgi:hypothetical protein